MSIRQLPQDVVDKIKSSVTVASLNDVACGLLKNSLDAGATKINLYVDHARGNCTVEDNGVGIQPQEFEQDGGLGKLHHTSKFPISSSVHGRRGDFLASLASLSLLTVTSRHQRRPSSSTLTLHNGNILVRHVPSSPEERFQVFDQGTRVVVCDVFGSMPVRVKHRASMATERNMLEREWVTLLSHAISLLLAWPTSVSVLLQDNIGQRSVRLKPPRETDAVSRISRLLTQAAIADAGDLASWVPVSAVAGQLSVSGCISMTAVASRKSQFLSFGVQPVNNQLGNNVLYEEVNRTFVNSSFGAVGDGDQRGREGDRDPAQLSVKVRKALERWPMFHFCIHPSAHLSTGDANEILDDRKPELREVLHLLQAVCYGFLKKHHFQPRKIATAKDESVFSKSRNLATRSSRSRSQLASRQAGRSSPIVDHSNSSSRSNSPFDLWHRVKVGLPEGKLASNVSSGSTKGQISTHRGEQLIGEGGKLLRKPFDEHLPEAQVPHKRSGVAGPEKCPDPPNASGTTGERRSAPAGAVTRSQSVEYGADGSSDRRVRRRLEKQSGHQPSEWLQDVLRKWDNPVFETAESAIPQSYDECPTRPLETDVCHASSKSYGGINGGVNFASASMDLDGRISRDSLSQADVVCQVDRKFILVKLPLDLKQGSDSSDSVALVMLDQHASDERCRLEELIQGYFEKDGGTGERGAVIEDLERSIVFELPILEGEMLEQYQTHLHYWGIVYRVHHPATMGESGSKRKCCRVEVTGLPPAILERCRTEPRILAELIRKEVWKVHDDGLPQFQHVVEHEAPQTAAFSRCPRGILDMLHSRSCRSAIMFNDVLSREECRQLVGRLSRCAFPFQCAHGRPSMAPLLDLGVGHRVGGWAEGKGDVQVGAWKRWIGQ